MGRVLVAGIGTSVAVLLVITLEATRFAIAFTGSVPTMAAFALTVGAGRSAQPLGRQYEH